MKKRCLIFLPIILLSVLGCKKDHSSKETDDDVWKSPECSAENSLLIAEMIVNGTDTTIYDFVYDAEDRLISQQNRKSSLPFKTVKYIDSRHYLVTSYTIDGAYAYCGMVSLDDEMKLNEIMIYIGTDTSRIDRVKYEYTGKFLKQRLGYETTKDVHYGNWVNYDSILYNWTGNNLTYMTSYYEHKLSTEQSIEYLPDSKCFLDEYNQPVISFSFGYPVKYIGATKSENFVRKINTKSYGIINGYSDSTVFEPIFDVGNKLIRNTEKNYYNGEAAKRIQKIFLYKCK